jgi:SAM-dependent MidA family methyltransferase
MPDAIPKPPSGDVPFPQDYPNPMGTATPSLREKILAAISKRGGIPFPEYLGMALYDPELGYYARPGTQVGRAGDFYTSVSVGPLFGKLLARRFLGWWEEKGKPAEWRILEIGAHDGTLAADILSEIHLLSPDAWQALEYAIPEPLPRLRGLQKARLDYLASRLLIAESFEDISARPLPGIAFGNEILDALPFHLIDFRGGAWQELHVIAGENGTLALEPRETSLQLAGDFPEGYRTEVRTNFPDFLAAITACLTDGLLIFADYGFAAPEYYDVHRSSGTLRTFSFHQAGEDPFAAPGETDITAHVDFTDLAKAAIALGHSPSVFTSQGSYLTQLAKPLILSGGMDDPKTIAQFQSLTHPAHLGAKFHVIELNRSPEIPPQVAHRLAL